MPGPTQQDQKKEPVQAPTQSNNDSSSSPPPPDSLKDLSMPSGFREEFRKEQTRDQQAMVSDMSKGRSQPNSTETQEQNRDKGPQR